MAELKDYFTRENDSIIMLHRYIKEREEKVLPRVVAQIEIQGGRVSEIDKIAVDRIVKSINDEVAESNKPLILLLNQEEAAWTNLKVALREGNIDAMRGLVTQIRNFISREKKLIPRTPLAQRTFLQMTIVQMQKASANP